MTQSASLNSITKADSSDCKAQRLSVTLTNGSTQDIAYHRYQASDRVDATPGIVFLGGFMSDMTGSKATHLDGWCREHGRDFVRFDYLGHGESSGRFEEGTIGIWADNAIAVLDALTEGPQILVGSSMGGWIMLLAALARPERVAGLVGIAAAPDFTEDLMWQRFDDEARKNIMEHGVHYVPNCYEGDDYPITRALIEDGRGQCVMTQDVIPITCPVRLLQGMQDVDVPWELACRLAQQLESNDVRVVLDKEADHRMSDAPQLALLTQMIDEVTALCR